MFGDYKFLARLFEGYCFQEAVAGYFSNASLRVCHQGWRLLTTSMFIRFVALILANIFTNHKVPDSNPGVKKVIEGYSLYIILAISKVYRIPRSTLFRTLGHNNPMMYCISKSSLVFFPIKYRCWRRWKHLLQLLRRSCWWYSGLMCRCQRPRRRIQWEW